MKPPKKFYRFLILALVVVFVAGCGGAESRKAKYLERGKDYLAQENFEKARIEFKNALQIDPKSAEGYYYLGQVEQNARNMRVAFSYYMKALELKPDYHDAQLKLGRFYLAIGDRAKAREMADAILAKDAADPDGRVLNAAILAVEGDTANAIKRVSDVLESHPMHADALDLLSSIYSTKGQTDKAIEVLEKAASADRKNILLRTRLARLYAETNALDKAELMLKEIVSLEPENTQNWMSLALFYSRTNRTGEAEKVLRDALSANPKDAGRHLLLTDFLVSRQGLDVAEKHLLSAIDEYPDEFRLRFGLAAVYERMKRLDKMEEVYREIISRDGARPDGLRARNFLANLFLLQGKNIDAVDQLNEEVLSKNPRDNEALEIKGKVALFKKKPQDAVTAFRTILKDQPESANILALLAEAHMASGEKDLAREHFLKALEHDPAYVPARIKLAQFYAVAGNVPDALKVLDDGLKTTPNNLELLTAKVDVYATKKDTKRMREILATIKSHHPDSPIGPYRMGKLLMAERKYGEALTEFERAWEKSSGERDILVSIVNTLLAQRKPDMAIDRLNTVLQKSPQSAFVYEMLGEVYASQKKFTEAEKQFRKAIELNPSWPQPYGSLAKLLQMQGDVTGSIHIYEQGLTAAPDDLGLMLFLAGAHERAKSYEKAIDAYEKILEKDSNNVIAANNLAVLLCDRRSDEKSFVRARELVERFQNVQQPFFRDTVGWVYYRNGETDKAIAVLDKVVSEAPNIAVFRYHLGMAFYKKGDIAGAKTHLSKAVAGKSEFDGKAEAQSVLQKIQ